MKVQVTKTLKKIVQMRYEDGMLKVVANCFISNRRLRQIIEQNSEWINQQRQSQQIAASQSVSSQEQTEKEAPKTNSSSKSAGNQLFKDILYGRKTLVLGDVVKVSASVSNKTYLDGNVLYISEKYYNDRETRLRAIKAYLKKMAQLYVAGEISNFGSSVSLCPVKIEFRDISEFWVSCSLASQKILCFDFRIVQLPQNLRIYIIAHAFAHFTNPIHDERFWNYVSNVMPAYKDLAKQLEKYHFLKDV